MTYKTDCTLSDELLDQITEQGLDVPLELWDVPFDCLPDRSGIDVEVVVHEDVSHPDDLGPRDVGGTIPDIGRQGPDGFADDLQVAHEPVLYELVSLEHFSATSCIAFDALDGFEHVTQPLPRVPHRATAS